MSKQQPREKFTAEDVRFVLSSPVYTYGINLQPAERVADAVMRLNEHLAQEMQNTGIALSLDALDIRYQALLQELETSGLYTREEDLPPIVPKDQWLKAQLVTIEKLSRNEKL